MLRPLIALVCLAFACLAARPAQAKEARAELRVVSWNVWGVPFVSDSREPRMRRIGAALAELRPNVVLLQELWSEEDAQVVIRALAQAGLTHEVHGASVRFAAFGSSGLLIAADRPLQDADSLEYELGRWPHTPYHLDWLSRKAALLAGVDTSAGRLLVVNTHWQAAYRTGNYAPVRVAQSLELCDWLAQRAAPHTFLAGDFNVAPGERATELLSERIGLAEVAGGDGLDRIFTSGLELERAGQVFTEAVPLDDGESMPLSDHPAWVADLRLVNNRSEMKRAGVEASLGAELGRESRILAQQRWIASGLAIMGALLLLRIALGSRVRGLGFGWYAGRRRAVRRLLLFATASGTAYAAYFAWGYGPAQAQGLAHASERLRR